MPVINLINHLSGEHEFEGNMIFCPMCGRDCNYSDMKSLKSHISDIHLKRNFFPNIIQQTHSNSSIDDDNGSLGVPDHIDDNENAEFSPDIQFETSINNHSLLDKSKLGDQFITDYY